MADKRIQDLTPASSVQTSDRFVLEQSGQAKSLTGQILINDLAAFLDGHGGIADISYTPPSGSSLVGTLTVTLADETVETFSVTNGRGITSFTKTGTSGLEDTYTITYNDGSTPTEFTVTNGRSIESIGYVESVGLDDYYQIDYNDGDPTTFIVHNGEKGDTGDNWYVHIKWAAVMPTQDSDMVNIPSDFIGIYAGISATAPTDYTEYAWYDYKGEKGDTGTSISSVAWQSSSGLVDTYRVNFDDGTSTTFNVTNGSNISSITKTSTVGLVDTYTVSLTNGNQTSFQVNNGKSIVSIAWTNTTSPTGVPHVPGATDTYTVSYNDGDSTTFQVYNGLDGEGASITVDGIPSVNGNVPLLVIDTEHGAPTPQTQGSAKSRYFDAINSVLYICLGYDENNGYIWRGAGVTVDSALSTSSTNPVQNRVITNKIGTAALNTTAQNLSGAVNEILDDISGFADNLADEYDATATYEVGDLRLHDNTLYRCNTAISTPEAWNSIHWTQTSVDEQLDGKVSKSGDTMSGNLTLSDGRYLIQNSSEIAGKIGKDIPQNYIYNSGLYCNDKDGNQIFYSEMVKSPQDDFYRSYAIKRLSADGNTTHVNGFYLYIHANGTREVVVTDPAAWRTALNAVNKGGDTMTNTLRIKGSLLSNNSDTPAECDVMAESLAGKIYLYSHGSTTGNRGIYGVSHGGTGQSIITVDQQNYVRLHGDADNVAGTVAIANGGTGQTGTTTTSVVSQIITAASGVTINGANFYQWGKVASIWLDVTCSSAIGVGGTTIGTVVSGKRPPGETAINMLYPVVASGSFINSGGSVIIRATISASTRFWCSGTYILA